MELMVKLLMLFIVVPATELVLLIEVGRQIGTINTLLLIVATGVLGASLAGRQGVGVVRKIQTEMASGHLPGDAIFDGLLILIAGIVLMTPGILTDIAGFLCLIPAMRRAIKAIIIRRMETAVQGGSFRVVVDQRTRQAATRPSDDGQFPPLSS